MSETLPRLNAALEGRYEVERELGAGGMATVYLATDLRHQRQVALKVLSPAISPTPRAVHRFQREARAAGRLQHTNIVPVFEVGQDGEILYYAMQLMGGNRRD